MDKNPDLTTFGTYDKDKDGYRVSLRTSDNLDLDATKVEHVPDLDTAHKLIASLDAIYLKNLGMAAHGAPALLSALDDLRRAAEAKVAAIARAQAAIAAALEGGWPEGAIAETLRVDRKTVRAWQAK
jgi:DNA-binding NarL/FixJ family response regulator